MFTKGTEGDILYIRHGETIYNKHLALSKETQISEKFIDSSLSEEGVQQAKQLSKNLKELEIKFVFCSPLNRCLETAMISLESHAMKKEIHVIIHPYISEVIHGSQDINLEISKKKEKFNEKSEIKFDWSYFDLLFPSSIADHYFLHFVDNVEEDCEELQSLILKLKSSEIFLKHGLYSKFLEHYISNNKRPETLSHLFQRACLFKEFLKKFKKQIIDKKSNSVYELTKTLVITHSAFIRMSTTEIGYKMDTVNCYPEDCYRPSNCEIISINI